MIEDHRQFVRDELPQNGFGIDVGCRSARHKIGKFGVDRNFRPDVELVCEGSQLPFKDNSLDYVSACHVLEHIPNPKLALVEWIRVLKENGQLLIVVPNAEASLRQGVIYWEHVVWFTPKILSALIENWLGVKIYYFDAREDLKDGPMIFCYGRKPKEFTVPRLPL